MGRLTDIWENFINRQKERFEYEEIDDPEFRDMMIARYTYTEMANQKERLERLNKVIAMKGRIGNA